MEILFNALAMGEFYNVSEEIEIAKGKNKIPMTVKEGFKKAIRKAKWSQKQ